MNRQTKSEIKLRSASTGSRLSGTGQPGVRTGFFARMSGVTIESASRRNTDGDSPSRAHMLLLETSP